ncbi:phospholipase D-like domain-containing protein [Mesorhizobium xinjiangense]|uniref:hypothetical protein n=1 Tax=Mesorhizobium xinjiangense TaxID=2678685 RepID=UPI0012ED877F|nr:hypothetical protein [Mesorhizobium xinjiangense]
MSGSGDAERLPLLKSIKDMAKSGAKLDVSIVTTYAFNGLFYEEVLLRAFERAGSRLNIVLADVGQLSEAMADPLRRPARAGVDYLLAPISHVGAFHPKIIALLSEKQPLLAIGSHNATDAGYSHNEELTAYWGIGRIPPSDVLRDAVDYAASWLQASEAINPKLLSEIRGRLDALLPKNDQPASREISFLGSRSESSLWDQIRERITGVAKRVWLVGPFFDSDLSLLRTIHQSLAPEEIVVGIQPETAVLPQPDLAPPSTKFVDAAAMERFWPEPAEIGFVHGKAFAIETTDGLIVSLGSANPTGAGWLSQRIWNIEANLCLVGESGLAAFDALGLEKLAEAAPVEQLALEEIAARSRELRHRERESSDLSHPPVLVGKLADDRLLIAGLQIPEGSEVILQAPDGGEISATVASTADGISIELRNARLVGGIHRLSAGDGILAFVLLNDEKALRAASLPRESLRILDHLGALDNTAGFTELLDLLDRHVLDKPDPVLPASSRPQKEETGGAHEVNSEVPFGPRGVSLPLPQEGASRRPRLNDGFIADIISALIRSLAAPTPAPSKDGDAPDLDEGDTQDEPSSDQLAQNLDADPDIAEVDWPRLVTACRKRLSHMINRLEARLEEAAAGTHTPAWALGRMVVVLSLLQQLRKHPPQVNGPISGRIRPTSLVSTEQLKKAFDIAVRALYGSGRIAQKLEAAANTRAAEERLLIDNLLLWFAREIGADCASVPGQKIDISRLQARADVVPVALSAAAYSKLEPWAEYRDPCLSVWDDSLPVDLDWTEKHIAFGRLLHGLRSVDLPTGRLPVPGELVQWLGERDLPFVLASANDKKAILLEPAGAPAAEKKVLTSSIKLLDLEHIARGTGQRAV